MTAQIIQIWDINQYVPLSRSWLSFALYDSANVMTERHQRTIEFFHQTYISCTMNEARVPHTIITKTMQNRIASTAVHLPSIATLAPIGPRIHIKNAEKAPKNAMRELNPGT